MSLSHNARDLVVMVGREDRISEIVRPSTGWLRPLREALGLTLAELAKRLKVTPPAVRSFELAESEDRITLGSLRRTADAMDCELVYALVPRTGTFASLKAAEANARSETTPAASAPPPEPPVREADSKKVTDRTWHTLHGES